MPIVLFIIGTCFGSFIRCMAQRYLKHESVFGRSHCDYCGHTLHFFDLIPVISYLFLKGRCRYCHKQIDKALLFDELAAGFLFVTFYLKLGLSISYLSRIGLLISFLILSEVDQEIYEIPDVFLLFGLLCGFRLNYLKETFFFSCLLILFVFLFYKVTGHEGMGGGDIKMLMVCSLSMGVYQTICILCSACFLGMIYSLIKKETIIPFGPFITFGFIIVTFI